MLATCPFPDPLTPERAGFCRGCFSLCLLVCLGPGFVSNQSGINEVKGKPVELTAEPLLQSRSPELACHLLSTVQCLPGLVCM